MYQKFNISVRSYDYIIIWILNFKIIKMEFITLLIDNNDNIGLRLEHTRISSRINDNMSLLWQIVNKKVIEEIKVKIEEDKKRIKLIESVLHNK